jgi:hypothetical protein
MSFANVANVAPLVKEGEVARFCSVLAQAFCGGTGYADHDRTGLSRLRSGAVVRPDGARRHVVRFRADMSSVGERELLRPKIRRRPPVPGVPPTIPTANRKHGQMEFPIPSGALDALPFAMHVVKDARTEHRKSAEQGTRFSAYKPSAWRNPTRWRSICPFRYTTSPSP